MPVPTEIADRLRTRLERLYPERAGDVWTRLMTLLDREPIVNERETRWDERDTVLITYGDMVRQQEGTALAAQTEFLRASGLEGVLSTVHLLPFFPWSSDDGFSIIDYREVADDVGTWQDVEQMGEHFDLMFDLVLNHVSQESEWFRKFLAGTPPYDRYFLEVDPGIDLRQVTRPRSLPLLSPFPSDDRTRHVWTTFSPDQVDLNFEEPQVLLEVIDVFLFYIERGARIIRLDAIAYLWKTIGTTCIHLDETHEVVKLMRDVLDAVAPHVVLLTETNVPHRENVSYFGDGDEAHMVYQFSLPPLLFDAFLHRDASPLNRWLSNLEPAPPGTTYFNFTSSHDGIGVRPLEGLVDEDRFEAVVQGARDRGGKVNTKTDAQGNDTPYELNITYWNAMGEPDGMPEETHIRRFLGSQAVMLALRGIPGIYFHCLVGTPNDQRGVEETGHNRRINRRKYDLEELDELLSAADGVQHRVFAAYRDMLNVRIAQPAFHPDAAQIVHSAECPEWILFERIAENDVQRILVVVNVTDQERTLGANSIGDGVWNRDLLENVTPNGDGSVTIPPYASAWLTN